MVHLPGRNLGAEVFATPHLAGPSRQVAEGSATRIAAELTAVLTAAANGDIGHRPPV